MDTRAEPQVLPFTSCPLLMSKALKERTSKYVKIISKYAIEWVLHVLDFIFGINVNGNFATFYVYRFSLVVYGTNSNELVTAFIKLSNVEINRYNRKLLEFLNFIKFIICSNFLS